MKFLRNVLTTVAVVAMGVVGVFAQSDSEAVVQVINIVQTISNATSATLQVSVSNLTSTNWATEGAQIISGLKSLAMSVNNSTVKLATFTEPFPAGQAAEHLVGAMIEFISVHEYLLRTLRAKHSLAATFSLAGPIAAALRPLRGVFYDFAAHALSLIPAQLHYQVHEEFAWLSLSYEDAIEVYS